MGSDIYAHVSYVLVKNKKVSDMYGLYSFAILFSKHREKKRIFSVLEVIDAGEGHKGFI